MGLFQWAKQANYPLLVCFDDKDVESPSLAAPVAVYELWCKTAPTLHSNDVLEVLANFNGNYFRKIIFFLTVLSTLPVTTATKKRSFSTTKNIKTFYRSKMNDARLSMLAVLAIHRDDAMEPNEVKPGLKLANTSMSVPPLASYKWAIKHKRNKKTTEKQARSNPYCPILGPCPTLGTIASGNFL